MGEVVLSLTRNPSAAVYDMTTYMALSLTMYPYPLQCIKRLQTSPSDGRISAHCQEIVAFVATLMRCYEFMSDNLPTSESAS